MDLQNRLFALEIGELDGDSAVKTARPGECRVQRFRMVGGGKNDDAGVLLKAVHVGEQLVQSLLPLIIPAIAAAAALLADGVDLINKYDAGGFFLRLFEKVTYLGCAHTHEHLDKFRAGDREEGDAGFTCNGLGEHCLTGFPEGLQ